jgi:hypothetical protein
MQKSTSTFLILFLLLNLTINPLFAGDKSKLAQQVIKNIEKETILLADKMIAEKPVTVTASSCKRSAGGLHDFYSEGDYWWPDPANPNGPERRSDQS